MLATVREGQAPRIHPVNVGIIGGRLYTFVIGRSPKRMDLETDGRYALHTHVDPAAPDEFSVRGRALPIEADAVRSSVAAEWPFSVDQEYRLFELSLDSVLLGRRAADDWPPRYSRWSASAPG